MIYVGTLQLYSAVVFVAFYPKVVLRCAFSSSIIDRKFCRNLVDFMDIPLMETPAIKNVDINKIFRRYNRNVAGFFSANILGVL